jgi:hypothetical protein
VKKQDPDPYQNVTDPEQWLLRTKFFCPRKSKTRNFCRNWSFLIIPGALSDADNLNAAAAWGLPAACSHRRLRPFAAARLSLLVQLFAQIRGFSCVGFNGAHVSLRLPGSLPSWGWGQKNAMRVMFRKQRRVHENPPRVTRKLKNFHLGDKW